MNEVKICKLNLNEQFEMQEMDYLGTNAALKDLGGQNKVILLIHASIDDTVTIKGGDGVFGGKDLVFSVQPGHYNLIQLEAGRFLQTTGENAGSILLSCEDGTVQAAAIIGK